MITSTQNQRVTAAARLKKRGLRERYRRFLVEGAQATEEAVSAGVLESVFVLPGATGRVPDVARTARDAGVEVVEVSEAVMAHLTSAVTPQGIVGVARFVDVPLSDLRVEGIIPVLCAVRDPGNAGTVLRSADAAGAAGLAFSTGSVDVYNQKTVRASAGSLFHLPVVRDADAGEVVEHLRRGGATIFAADAHARVSMHEVDLRGPVGLLLGNEAWGLPEEIRGLADEAVRVPIRGQAESLNLAAAAALMLFEAARQRAGSADVAEVVSAFGHDLRLPLTALKGFATTLVDRWDRFDDPVRRELVQGMLLDLDRLAAAISLLVDSARLARGRLRHSGERHAAGPALERIRLLFAGNADYPDVVVEGDAEIGVDRPRLEAVLLTLCEATLWWGREGPISIRARTADGAAIIEVSREGELPPDPESVFGPPDVGGKIGLRIARRVIEAIGGELSVASDPLTFRLSLPA